MSVLELRGLTVTYRSEAGPVPAVRGVDLTVAGGESVGLAGESGCGKSTVAAAVLRLLPPGTEVGGQILLDGEDVATMKPGRLRAVRWTGAAIVFQGALHSLNPVRRIGWQIDEAIELHGTRQGAAVRARTVELLERVGLPAACASLHPHQLSGGQRQRVLIAVALACEPHLLIADEPTTALDVMVQAQVLALLAELQRDQQLAMLFITHDLSLIGQVCDRLAVMYAGRVVEHGPAADVLGHSVHPYSAALAAAFPTIGDPASRLAPRGLPGDPPDPAAMPPGCAFAPRCPVVVPACTATDVALRVVTPGHEAACLRVGGER